MSEEYWELHQEIQNEKKLRIRNLPQIYNSTDISYFIDKDINIDNLKEFLIWNQQIPYEKIEWSLPILTFEKDSNIIIKEVETYWPFKTPAELVRAIAKVIKSHLKYNMITSMKLVFENVNALERIIDNPELLAKISEDYSRTNKLNWNESLEQEKKEFIKNGMFIPSPITWEEISIASCFDNSSDIDKLFTSTPESAELFLKINRTVLLQTLESSNFELSESQRIFFSNQIERFSEINWEKYKNWISQITNILKGSDIKNLSQYIKKNLHNNNFREFFKLCFLNSSNLIETEWITIKTPEITEIFNDVKIWVCRHYSMMAKIIFTKMAEDHFSNLPEKPELMYVMNNWMRHAYNLLIWDDEQWITHKEYFDITTYIIWNKLEKQDIPKEKSIKEEFFVQNNKSHIGNENIA